MDRIWSGRWWTPQTPTPVPGILHKPEGRLRLDLIGNISTTIDGDNAEAIGGSLVFGSARGRRYTIEGARLSSEYQPFPPGSSDAGLEPGTQSWECDRLLEGGHVPEGTEYSKIDFRLTGLPDWWLGRDAPALARLPIEEDVWLTISEVRIQSQKDFVRAQASRAQVTIEADNGITYAKAFQRIIFPMIALLSIALMRECKVFAVQADPMGSGDWASRIVFNPGDGHDSEDARLGWPVFVATDVDAEVLLTSWLRLAPHNLRALESAMYSDAPGRLFSDAFDAVSAAEGLDRYLHHDVEQPTSKRTARVLEALKHDGGFDEREMNRIRQTLTRSESSLEGRLAQLVRDMGDAVAARLLGTQAKAWAYTAATYRNALAHGLRLRDDLQLDPGLSIAVAESTRAVLRSRLLLASGMTEAALLNMLGEELVWRTPGHQDRIDWRETRRRIGG